MERKTQIAVLAIVLIVAIGAATVLPSLADSDTSTGNFSLGNSAPTSLTFDLYVYDHSTNTTSMTPQVEYALKIDVTDWNTLNDISEIKVIIKTNGTDMDASNSATDKATYNWTSGGWSLVGPSGSTWNITDNSSAPSDLNATTGTWWLHFIPGKVANETVDDYTWWDIYVNVTDKGGLSTDNIAWGFHMNWYGEISALNDSYSFGYINLGDTDKNITTPSDKNIDVKTISNGNYTIQSKSVNWTNGDNTAVLNWSSSLNSGEFALKVSKENNVDNSNFVNTSYTVITGYDNVNGPTAEAGAINEIYQWISVASSGLPPGTYEGTFYVLIDNA